MILKSFELNKIDLNKNKIILMYGKNEGLKNESLNLILKNSKHISNFDEKEILENSLSFLESALSKSLFENEKIIIIKRATDKIFKIIEEIIGKNIKDISIILKASTLEKKSKIRNFFEKQKETICIPVYEDNYQTLNIIIKNFLNKNKIILSQEIINIIIERARGDRINLKNELDKLKYFSTGKKKIELEQILNLTNLAENHNISELVDNSLAKNKKKTLYILNENNFASDDCIQIVRIYLSKLKRLLNIKSKTTKNNNIEQVISSYKPPIFWKEKDIVKQQVKIWKFKKIEDLIVDTNDLEYQIKKNPNASLPLLKNFILEKTLEPNSSL